MEITKKHLILGKDCIEDLPHMKQFDRIFLTGDKHRAFDEMYDDAEKIGFTERDLLVFLGDVCVNYYGATPSMAAEDRSAKNELSSLFPCTFLCIHGNHEMRPTTPEIAKQYHKINWMGDFAYVEDAFPRLIFAEDGARYTINGREFLVIGGAYSVDKWYRIQKRIRWFPDEQLTGEEMMSIQEKVKTHGNKEDIILAHTCPMNNRPLECFLPGIDDLEVDTTMERFLQQITDSAEYNELFCGHWHTDKKKGKIRFLFHDIVMLEEKTEKEK